METEDLGLFDKPSFQDPLRQEGVMQALWSPRWAVVLVLLAGGCEDRARPVHESRPLNAGVIGYSGAGGADCRACHTAPNDDPPLVELTGPVSVQPGTIAVYTFSITPATSATDANGGGLGVAVTGGSLRAGSGSRLQGGELVHDGPRAGRNLAWVFEWQAPPTPGTYTIYAAGNSVNLDGTTANDEVAKTQLTVTIPGTCGNEIVEAGETCDPPSSCPTSCDDHDACTVDSMTGTASQCNVECRHDPLPCTDNDGCCPPGCTAANDDDCSANCGNGVLDPGETCDPPSSCPTACDDGNACTEDTLVGNPSLCNVSCTHAPLTACTNGDGCCPAGCTAASDSDCTTLCGNGESDRGESCDPPTRCPTTCDDGNACTQDLRTGSPLTCNLVCAHNPVVGCTNGDGCCPAGCNAAADDDCSANCGNGVVEPGETCDPPSSCPTSCDDGNACTRDILTGSAERCNVACSHAALTVCRSGDGCCPAGCDAASDDDCSARCGSGVLEPGETCDPPSSCPTTCDDGNPCTIDTMTGSAANCNVACSYTVVVSCRGGDGCCPAGCNVTVDSDCSASCGNGALEGSETCDPAASCPASCDDGDACTIDVATGSAATCGSGCGHTRIVDCRSGDGCCPAGCDAAVDADCAAVCGNGVVEPGETCDPPESCQTSCDDGDACTLEVTTGSADQCSATCVSKPIRHCVGGDGCCPEGCGATVDSDCAPRCGNGWVEGGETCDPPGSCPTSCDDGDACTQDQRSGSAEECTASCTHTAVVACIHRDGCCPPGCHAGNDTDCRNPPPSSEGCQTAQPTLPLALLLLGMWAWTLLRRRSR